MRVWPFTILPQRRNLASLGFPSMGKAIRRRARRLAFYWEFHLQQTQTLQERWLSSLPNARQTTISILGAGGLYDVNLNHLAQPGNQITFVDACSIWQTEWRRAKQQFPSCHFIFEIADITGHLQRWKSALHQSRVSDIDDACKMIADLPETNPVNALPARGSSVIISLNLISQIPIVWQHIVEDFLIRQFGRRLTQSRETQWLRALVPSAQLLITQHLALINESLAQEALIFSDLEYLHYRNWTPPRSASGHLPFALDMTAENKIEGGHWVNILPSETKISAELIPALYGLDFESPDFWNKHLSNFSLTDQATWLWHIAPLGVAGQRYGEINRVAGFFLTRNKRTFP